MNYIPRVMEAEIASHLSRGKSILLLGARQTGKTTLLTRFKVDLSISLIEPAVRQQYEKYPAILQGEIEALYDKNKTIQKIIIDEVQFIPELLNVIQSLIDRKVAQFILTGSSARKLKVSPRINLLPGRVVVLHLDPLMGSELNFQQYAIEDILYFGSLPGLIQTPDNNHKTLDLLSYVTTYLEEEIRREAVVRQVGTFARFLELAAAESGKIINFSKLSQEIGVAHTTIRHFYQILEDCLIAERVEPFLRTQTRRRLIKSQKYILFDLGVRRVCAREGLQLPDYYLGLLFEQYVGLELIRQLRISHPLARVHYWRDVNGIEVDWVIDIGDALIPIEVKWSATPTNSDIKLVKKFMEEYKEAKVGYVICRCKNPIKLADNILALPWQQLQSILEWTGNNLSLSKF